MNNNTYDKLVSEYYKEYSLIMAAINRLTVNSQTRWLACPPPDAVGTETRAIRLLRQELEALLVGFEQ